MPRPVEKHVVLFTKKDFLSRSEHSIAVTTEDGMAEAQRIADEMQAEFPEFSYRILDHETGMRHLARMNRTPGARPQHDSKPGRTTEGRFPAARLQLTQIPSGHHVSRMMGVPALPKPIEKERWSARDALQAVQNLTVYYRSIFGFMEAKTCLEQMGDDNHLLPNPHDNALHEASVLADEETMVILAQPDFTQMLLAAAISAPSEALHHDELLAKNGILFFSEEQDFSELTMSAQHPVRAIQWMTVESLRGTHMFGKVLYEGHHEWSRLLEVNDPANTGGPDEITIGFPEAHKHLLTSEYIDTSIAVGRALPSTSEFSGLLGLFRSISAIAGSTHTQDVTITVPEKKKARKRKSSGSAKASADTPQVRVLSLVNSDYGQYEIDAATGRKLRQHWVRGHWRNQWYSSIQQNRRIWVDGFVRGNRDLGTITAPKVYVAR